MTHLNTYSWVWAILSLLFLPLAMQAQGFFNPISIPYQINSDNIRLRIDETQHNFNPNAPADDTLNTMINTFAFNHMDSSSITYLGPTIHWSYLHDVNTQVFNNLPDQATVHWHGGHVPTYADGGPHQRIAPGDTWDVNFQILDKSATMWYHPHVLNDTYVQVQMGMSGMLYVDDPTDGNDDPVLNFLHQILPTNYGVNDFPLIIQTKKFKRNDDGDMQIDTLCCGPNTPGYKKDYEYIVNGYMNPYIELPASMVRLRVLNGDAKFAFDLGLTDLNFQPDWPFELIALDAGYCDRTYEKESILMAPGERTEWLVDLRGREGDTLYLSNLAENIDASIIGSPETTENYAQNKAILRIIVGEDTGGQSPIIGFPIGLLPLEIPEYDDSTPVRTKTMYKEGSNLGGIFTIDHEIMDINVINDTVMLGSTEIWEIVNTTDIAHPWHIHDVHFHVIEVTDANGNLLDPNGHPELFKGPVDNVLVPASSTLKYVTKFEDYGTHLGAPNSVDSTYMFHCHILPHEDRGMMGQFVVWNGELVNAIDNPEGFTETGDFTLFPNPAQSYVMLEGKNSAKSAVRIYNTQGQLVGAHQLDAFDGAVKLPLDDYKSGLYVLEWATKEGRFIKRLLVQED